MRHPELVKDIPEFIASMEELIRRYQAAIALKVSKLRYERDNEMSCLLCSPLGIKKTRAEWYEELKPQDGFMLFTPAKFKESCCKLGCPWITILGMTCETFSKKNLNFGNTIYNTPDPITMKRRIRQIKNWIKIYRGLLPNGSN